MNLLKKLTGPILIVAVIAGSFFAWNQRWAIYDYIRLRNYTPSERIQQVANEATMDEETRRLFYVYYPSLEDKSGFRQHCSTAEQSIVLGCYVSGQGIYLADINDERLDGIVEVTAAHEVLHAAYERLGESEKQALNKQLRAAFKNVKSERIRSNVESYRKNGADVDNELHSILGTEVRNLPAELESYYGQYFDDRMKVVSLSEKYEQTFTSLKQQVKEYDQQLVNLKSQIEQLQASLNQQESNLNAERQRLEQLAASNNISAYNAAVPGFNSMVNAYNVDVNRLRSLIDRYNNIVKLRNDVVVEQGELIEAIDSRPEPIKQ